MKNIGKNLFEPNLRFEVKSDTKVGYRRKIDGVCHFPFCFVCSLCNLLVGYRLLISYARLTKSVVVFDQLVSQGVKTFILLWLLIVVLEWLSSSVFMSARRLACIVRDEKSLSFALMVVS